MNQYYWRLWRVIITRNDHDRIWKIFRGARWKKRLRLFIIFILLFIHSLCINYRIDWLTIDLSWDETAILPILIYCFWKIICFKRDRKGLKILFKKEIVTWNNFIYLSIARFILDLITEEKKKNFSKIRYLRV